MDASTLPPRKKPAYTIILMLLIIVSAAIVGFISVKTQQEKVSVATRAGAETTPAITSASQAIPDTAPPAITISSPLDGAKVDKNSTILFKAAASDDRGVAKVDFAVNGVVRCTLTAPPYECVFKTSEKVGIIYALRATVYDSAGHSAFVLVNVTSR